ncbi:putative homoserine kinase type II (protein kinase fold) [Rhizobium leguminosarum bv. trifolii WSM2012]|nr:putative homoserine kinase type II (protein kinase fold) [Rhizobium leguminosarum bv. trifolii WSM2012]
MKPLDGGRTGQIWRDGNTIIRPSGAWTPTVHRFLRHLRSRGFLAAPEPIGISGENQEIVGYVAGRVCENLGDRSIGSERMLMSSARLLRHFHSASQGFLATDDAIQTWMLPPQEPREIVCHGDYAPYNVTTAECEAVGIIDFDTAHPAPRLWDLAYAVYRWAPLSGASHPGVISGLDEQLRRAELFCTAYETTAEERQQLPEMICRRLQALVNFMQARASAGDETFVEDVAAGDAQLYLSDIGYVQKHRDRLLKALLQLEPLPAAEKAE